MKKEYIYESGMKFGPFDTEKLIPIERVPQYTNNQQGMRICEFIFYKKEKEKLLYVEAKTSAPNPRSQTAENPKVKFDNFITEIKEKFVNALDLYVNMVLKKDVPKGFKEIDYHHVEIIFLLVIKNHETSWLKDVKDALEMSVCSELRAKKIWRCKVLVFNEEMAARKYLVQLDGFIGG